MNASWRLAMTIFWMCFVESIALGKTFYNIHSAHMPDAAEHRPIGLGIEEISEHNDAMLGFIDRSSLALRLFPRVSPLSEKARREAHEHNRIRRANYGSIDERDFTYLDAAYRLESCFVSKAFCLGLSPLTVNLFTSFDRIRTYFSPAISFRLQIPAASTLDLHVSYEVKTFFDKNAKDTIKREMSIWSLGLSF